MKDSPASRFLMVERQDGDRVTVLVHHLGKPQLWVEFEPRMNGEGKLTGGVLKRIRAENSWCGSYGSYTRIVAQAERFFHRSIEAGIPAHRFSI